MCTGKNQTQKSEKENNLNTFKHLLEDTKSPFFFPREFFISSALFLNCNPGLVICSLLDNEVHHYKFSYSRVENCKELKNESSNSL